EAAVVMLADTVEAAARVLPDPNQARMDALIDRLIQDKLADGQLDESPLTFRDLAKIRQAFSTVLTGVYHERVEYPAVDIPHKKPRAIATEAPPAKPASPTGREGA
ncbi:MAG: HD family phosphohydrolase, partial [Clostridiales bacterium]|nr:HD family phosphohydrolase [Clostridiales bacterium]